MALELASIIGNTFIMVGIIGVIVGIIMVILGYGIKYRETELTQ